MLKILKVCEKKGFLRSIYKDKSLDHLVFGPTGELLVNNIQQEWVYSCITNSSTNVFPFYRGSESSNSICGDLKDSFLFVKTLCKGHLPFSLAEIRQQSEQIDDIMGKVPCESEDVFKINKGTVLRSVQFLSPEEANRSFTKLQRDRKIWWRQFSSSPGRFKLSEVTIDSRKLSTNEAVGQSFQSVQILSDFDWGTGVVETIRFWPSYTFETKENHFKLREGKRSVVPCALETVLALDIAALVYLCDAFDDKTVNNIIMRFHRRIAPFKVSFSSSTSKELLQKANALAEHLTALLRKAGHTTLLLPQIVEEESEAALANYNEIGVPFTVVLTDSSLSDGIIYLYSRETSLKEQIHISQLVNYMNQLMNSR